MNTSRERILFVWLLFAAPRSPAKALPRPQQPEAILATRPTGSKVFQKILNDRCGQTRLSGEAAAAAAEAPHVVPTNSIVIGRLRTDFVKHILTDRLKYVRNGRRMADFHTWIRKRGGEVAVLSTHGVNVVDLEQESSTTTSLSFPENGFPYNEDRHHHHHGGLFTAKSDPFAMNRFDLDLPVNNLPSLYEGKPLHLIDDLEPSLVQLSWRAIQLSLKFAPVLSSAVLAAVSSNFRRVWYKWVATSLGSTSAAFIKWGQWAATRNDMFPDLLCQELEQLQSAAPAHPWSFSEKMMESSLGLPSDSLMDVFDDFDRKPLASGSIAQVYKAYLDGKPVAVKVRHPRVAQLIDMDFRIMTAFARICDWIPALSWLHVRESVEQFSHTMAAQAHLQVEAHHLEILNHNFRKWPHVKFPYPIYASSAVIVETFEPGAVVSDMLDAYDAMAEGKNPDIPTRATPVVVHEGDGGDVADELSSATEAHDLIPVCTAKFIVTTGLGLYLKMLLVDNLMHADLHPGNIMLAAVGKGRCEEGHDMDRLVVKDTADSAELEKHRAETTLRICLVDAGMVAQLTEDESSCFIGLLASLGQGDGRLAAKFALRFSVDNSLSDDEQEFFAKDMEELFVQKCRGYGTRVDIGEVLRGVLGLIRKHQVRIDASYATLVVNCLCVQSLALRVCPAYNVLDAGEPLLKSYFETFYEPDGTPRPRERAIQRYSRIMPVKYLQKSRRDGSFFRRIRQSRRKQEA